jgi:ribosomal protein L35
MAKSKMKVSKTVKERFKVTASGKILHSRGGVKHRRSKESTSLRMRGKRIKKLTGQQAHKFGKILGVSRRKGSQ